jgi:hypothetical protein
MVVSVSAPELVIHPGLQTDAFPDLEPDDITGRNNSGHTINLKRYYDKRSKCKIIVSLELRQVEYLIRASISFFQGEVDKRGSIEYLITVVMIWLGRFEPA